MATRKTAAAKVAATVSPEPVDQADGGAVDDVTVITTDEPDDVPAGAGAPSGGVGPVGGGAPASGRAGGASAAGTPHGHAAWVVPAPVPLAVAPAGSSGYYMGIKVGVDTKTGPFAGWLGTDGPRPNWPN
jgi:hypothetical protein